MKYTDIFLLNVGRGSCAVIAHPSGRTSMIDINNGRQLRPMERDLLLAEGATSQLERLEATLVNPIEWYQERFQGDLWRFVLSHPDADHMSGLRCLLERDPFGTTIFWDLPHTKPLGKREDYTSDEAFLDRGLYELMRKGADYENITWPQVIQPERFDSERYWKEDDIEILSPSHEEVDAFSKKEQWNDMSFVLRVSYGGRSVLLPGDIEQLGWDALAAACEDIRAHVLVASHHGRKSGFPDNGVIERINPLVVIVSSDKLPREHDATARYRNAAQAVYSTRTEGTIQIRIWEDGDVIISRESDGQALGRIKPLKSIFGDQAA